MFIELTDHLRCPNDHAEGFLVLLPERMQGRRVVAGTLGCPVCGGVFELRDGCVDFGGGLPGSNATGLPAEVAVLLGIEGPGGYLALVGSAAALAPALIAGLPGLRLVLVNPPPNAVDSEASSVLRAARLPLKSASMRGVIVGAPAAAEAAWIEAALCAVLPGNRVVVEGPVPELPGLEVLGGAAGVWVGRRLKGQAA
jgi:hypothetical protein